MPTDRSTLFPSKIDPITEALDNKRQSSNVETKKEKEKRTCLANDGVWDEDTQSCSFPNEDKSKIETFTDSETGNLSGFTRGGNTFLGSSPQETTDAVQAETLKQELPIGSQAQQVLSNREQQQAGIRAATEISQTPINPLDAAQEIKLSYVNAALSALPGIVPDAIIGGSALATTFGSAALVAGQLGPQVALPEEVATVPVAATTGAIIGAISGGLVGFYRSFISDLESQRSAAIEAPIRTLTETKPLLSDIINAQNANPNDRRKHIEQFELQQQLIQDDYDNLKDLTDSSLTKLLGENGINQLKEFNVYYSGEAQQLEFEFADALANPDPSKIRATSADIEKMKSLITGVV